MSRAKVASAAIKANLTAVRVTAASIAAAGVQSVVKVADTSIQATPPGSRVWVGSAAVTTTVDRHLIWAKTNSGWKKMFTSVLAPPDTDPATDLSTAGAVTLGSANYAIPAGAIFVATTGNDSTGTGLIGAPYATLAKAHAMASAGGTIVIRGGTYFEGTASVCQSTPTTADGSYSLGVQITKAGLTIQNYPGESVTFDGSKVLTGSWTVAGATWWLPYDRNFPRDLSNSQNSGNGSGNLGDGFVRPDYPCAHLPDQVWVDGTWLRQVGTVGAVTASTFYVDTAAQRLYIGTNPSGKTIRASWYSVFSVIIAANVTMRGFCVQRYAPSLAEFSLWSVRGSTTFENMHILEGATGGVAIQGSQTTGGRISHCTITDNGNLGVGLWQADDVVVEWCRILRNNREVFDAAPSAGGIKQTKSQRPTFRFNVIEDQIQSTNLWLDESVYDFKIYSNDLRNADGFSSLNTEISEKGIIADNRMTGSDGTQWNLTGTGNVRIWCNTCGVGGTEILAVLQDNRTPANTTYARDSRQPQSFYDNTMTWQVRGIEFCNNAIGPGSSASPYRVQQYNYSSLATQPSKGWASFGITSDGNLFNRNPSNTPGQLVTVWSTGSPGSAVNYSSLANWQAGSISLGRGADANSVEINGSNALAANGMLTSAAQTATAGAGRPLPPDIAALIGKTPGSTHIGCWR